MNMFIIGTVKEIVDMAGQLQEAGHSVNYTNYYGRALSYLERSRSVYDFILITECERLEDTDLIAGELKDVYVKPPCVVVLCDAVSGFEKASDYGLESIDFLLEKFSVDMCEQILQHVKDNKE